jgi:membrane protease subunit HflK
MSWDWEKLREQQQKQGGGGGMPPQFDEWLKQLKQLKLPGGFFIIIVILVIMLGASMFFTVGPDEVGVVQRFGAYAREREAGLHFKFPAGIEKVTKVKVKRVYKEEFGYRTAPTARLRAAADRDTMDVSLMLTGDLNVAIVPWIVQYRIRNPYDYLFKVDNVNSLLRDMAEAVMRLVVGDRSINEVISKREEIAIQARQILQKELTDAETGIHIVTIEMKKTNVPEPVQPSFNEVNQAIQQKEQMIYKAREDYNKAIPAARGEAERTVRAAEGYALDRVNRAKGDSERFLALYEEYAKAQDVTKRRLYLERLGEIYPKLGPKYIIDADQKNVLPFLNLKTQQEDLIK